MASRISGIRVFSKTHWTGTICLKAGVVLIERVLSTEAKAALVKGDMWVNGVMPYIPFRVNSFFRVCSTWKPELTGCRSPESYKSRVHAYITKPLAIQSASRIRASRAAFSRTWAAQLTCLLTELLRAVLPSDHSHSWGHNYNLYYTLKAKLQRASVDIKPAIFASSAVWHRRYQKPCSPVLAGGVSQIKIYSRDDIFSRASRVSSPPHVDKESPTTHT